jgi:hypothetical protein
MGIAIVSKRICRTFLGAERAVPRNSLFRNDLFDRARDSMAAEKNRDPLHPPFL